MRFLEQARSAVGIPELVTDTPTTTIPTASAPTTAKRQIRLEEPGIYVACSLEHVLWKEESPYLGREQETGHFRAISPVKAAKHRVPCETRTASNGRWSLRGAVRELVVDGCESNG